MYTNYINLQFLLNVRSCFFFLKFFEKKHRSTTIDGKTTKYEKCEDRSPNLGYTSLDYFNMNHELYPPPNVTCTQWEIVSVSSTSCIVLTVPQLPTLGTLNVFLTMFFEKILYYHLCCALYTRIVIIVKNVYFNVF